MPNLEPIEEKDIDLETKSVEKNAPKSGMENPSKPLDEKIGVEGIMEKNERVVEKESFYDKLLNQVKGQSLPAVEEDIVPDAENLTQKENVEKQISGLIELSKTKGVTHAVRVAKKLNDNYSLDEFHDRLCSDDELIQRLIKEGSIKNL